MKKLLESCPALNEKDAVLSSKGGDPFAATGSILLKRDLARVSRLMFPFEGDENKHQYWLEKLDGSSVVPKELAYGVQDIQGHEVGFEDYGTVLCPGAIVKISILLSTYTLRGREQNGTSIFAKLDPVQIRVIANGEVAKSLKPGRAVRL